MTEPMSPRLVSSRSTRLLNALANHPDIRPHLGGAGALEIGEMPDDWVFLIGDAGGGLFMRNAPNIYEGHWLFTEGGQPALTLAKAMVSAMLYGLGAEMVWGAVPVDNRRCRIFTRLAGLTSLGIHERPYQTIELFVARRGPSGIHCRPVYGER